MFPARMKKGMARSEKVEMPEKIRWAPVTTVASAFKTGRIAAMEEIPRATAMGTPAIKRMARVIRMIRPHTIAMFILCLLSFC